MRVVAGLLPKVALFHAEEYNWDTRAAVLEGFRQEGIYAFDAELDLQSLRSADLEPGEHLLVRADYRLPERATGRTRLIERRLEDASDLEFRDVGFLSTGPVCAQEAIRRGRNSRTDLMICVPLQQIFEFQLQFGAMPNPDPVTGAIRLHRY